MARVMNPPRVPVSLELADVQREYPNGGPSGWRQELERRAGNEQKHARLLRGDLERLCPHGRAIDVNHLVAMLGQAWSSHGPVQLARHFVAAGLKAEGFTDTVAGRVLGETPARAAQIAERIEWWDPPREMLDGVHPRFRSMIVGGRT